MLRQPRSVTAPRSASTSRTMQPVAAGTTRAIWVGGGNVRFGTNLTTARTRLGLGIDANCWSDPAYVINIGG